MLANSSRSVRVIDENGAFCRAPQGVCPKGVDGRRFTLSEKITALTPTITEKDAMLAITVSLHVMN